MDEIVIESPHLESWLRTSFVDNAGQVFLPCGAFGDEREAMLCVAHDGVPVVRHEGHVYAPSTWLAREYRRHAHVIETIAARITRAHEEGIEREQ